MTNPVPVPVSSEYLGIAKETTPLTGVAPTAFIPFSSPAPHDKVDYQFDEGLRGSMVKTYGAIPGTTESEFGWDGNVHTDTIGWPLAAILGDVATTGDDAPYTHVMAIKNVGQPDSYSLTEFYGVTQARQFAGQKFSEVALKFNADSLFTYSAKTAGAASTQVTAPTESFSGLTAIPGWSCSASIAGSSSLIVASSEIDLKRAVSVIHTLNGTQAPVAVFLGPLEVTGKMTLLMPDDTELERYLTNDQPAISLTYSKGSDATTESLTVALSDCAYTDATKNAGKDYQQIDVTITGIANTDDVGDSGGYGTPLVTLVNVVPGETYA